MARKFKKKPVTKDKSLLLKEPGQEYAEVIKMLGDRRVECLCYDAKTRICHIRGKMRKRVWITVGDIVLVCLRDFEDDKGDIIHKYSSGDIRKLRKLYEIPSSSVSSTNIGIDDSVVDFIFEDEENQGDEADIDIDTI